MPTDSPSVSPESAKKKKIRAAILLHLLQLVHSLKNPDVANMSLRIKMGPKSILKHLILIEFSQDKFMGVILSEKKKKMIPMYHQYVKS